jgi:FAD dependent oxidoreductase
MIMEQEAINYSISQKIPVTLNADVIVIGGGPGGLGAAVAAARNGADTLLIERFGFLGGMATAGEVSPFMGNHLNGESLDRPVYIEWVDAMRKYLPDYTGSTTLAADAGKERMINKDTAMLGSEDLCLDNEVRLAYHHTLFDVIVEDGKISTVILFSKSGLTAAKAKMFIDCTGDGDLSAKAGCEIEYGNDAGYCQPMTLCFKLAGVNKKNMLGRAELNDLYDKAKASGEIDCKRENVLWFDTLEDDVIHFNTTRVVMKSSINALELSEAEIDARRQLREYLIFLRKHAPGFENARIHSIAHHIGVRESRRVRGIEYIGVEAFETAQKFPDAIAKVTYPIDIHNPSGSGTIIKHLPQGDWYEISYGCIVARDVANLLVGGRPISVDHALHSSCRVMPPACSIGQAAGTAAAMCIKEQITPAELDGITLRAQLKAMGADL